MNSLDHLLLDKQVWRAEDNTGDRIARSLSGDDFYQRFPRGSIHEIYSKRLPEIGGLHSPISVALDVLKHQVSLERKVCVFIGRETFPTPFALRDYFQQDGQVKFENFLCLKITSEKLKKAALHTALSSGEVAAVFVNVRKFSFFDMQRFSLLAKNNGALCFFFQQTADTTQRNAAFARWQLEPLPAKDLSAGWRLTLLHTKGSKTQENTWDLRIDYEKKVPEHLFSQLVNQPHSEKPANRKIA